MKILGNLHESILACNACSARREARAPVPFSWPSQAMGKPLALVIGRNPGRDEDAQGKPFVGRSGQLLTEWLEAAGLVRDEDCIITNMVKCYTENNREPSKDEISVCIDRYLSFEIGYFNPRIIIGLGKQVTESVSRQVFSKLRGVPCFTEEGIVVFFTYHPSYALRGFKNRIEFFKDAKILNEEVVSRIKKEKSYA